MGEEWGCECEGGEVANRDSSESALGLDDEVCELGDVGYVWIAREDNDVADEAANDLWMSKRGKRKRMGSRRRMMSTTTRLKPREMRQVGARRQTYMV